MTTLEAIADRIARGGTLQNEEAPLVLASHDLIAIGMMADDVRRQLHGRDTTFLRVLEIHVDAVPSTVPAGVSAGEVRLVGRPASVEAACVAVDRVRRLLPDVTMTGFSLSHVSELASLSPGAFARLREAGLDGVAEVTAEDIGLDSIRAARDAGLQVQRIVVGVQPQDPLALFGAVRRHQDDLGGFQAFAPLPRMTSDAAPTTGYDDVKLVALARLLIREIPSIQVDWPLYGPKLAQVALTVGADDVDGVAAVESGALGTRRSAIEEITGNIRAAGLQPVERNGRFEVRVV